MPLAAKVLIASSAAGRVACSASSGQLVGEVNLAAGRGSPARQCTRRVAASPKADAGCTDVRSQAAQRIADALKCYTALQGL